MKRYIFAFILLVIIVVMSGCGNSENYDERLNRIEDRLTALEGQQSGGDNYDERLSSIENRLAALEGQQLGTISTVDNLVGVWKNDKWIYTFNDDETGDVLAVPTGGDSIFIYSVERKNTLIITYFSSVEEYRYTIKGDTLTITGDGKKIELERQK